MYWIDYNTKSRRSSGRITFMDTKEFLEDFAEYFYELLNKRKYAEARKMLDTYVGDAGCKINVAGCCIDLGSQTGDEELIKKGISSYERFLSEDQALSNEQRQCVYCNIGNGYYGLFERIRGQKGNTYRAFIDNEYLVKAMRFYQSAYEYGSNNPEIYVNYANVLDHQGRSLEAIDYYDKALKINNSHGMAYANKATCLMQLADISGEYQEAQYIYAYQLLKKAIENEGSIIKIGGPIALEQFQKVKKDIEGLFKDRLELLDQILPHSAFDWSSFSDELRDFYDFSSEHDLFLNLHVQDKHSKAALFDHVFISITTPVNDEQTFHQFADWINEIKESYMTARFLLFDSGRKTADKTHISKLTVITNPLDYSTKTIYTGLQKAAIKEAFGILDKIACFLNEYLDMGITNIRGISWDKIWFKNQQKVDVSSDSFWQQGVFHEKLENLEDYTLFSLFSLHLDIEKAEIRDLRNALTHRKVSVQAEGEVDTESKIDIATLEARAIQLLKFAKHAIIYLINFVNHQEKSKGNDSGRARIYVITDQFI